MEKWLGGINDVISTVVEFFRGKVSSAEYSNCLIKIVDEDGNVRYYNETNNAQINLPNENNRFSNYAYGATVSGGSKNDTIYSDPNPANSSAQGNSIIGGSGNDFIVAYDDNSTIDGGTDDDRIAIFGKNNKICGDNGTDAILLESGANDNTIDSGRGNDYIILEDDVKNAVILYTEGDGNDIILGYDENDEIRILADYSASVNGQDVIIGVGNDSITLSGAAGKEININGTKQVIGSKPTNPPLVITLPSIWHEDTKVIRGTSANDRIENFSSNLLINAGQGNDSVFNGLDNWDGGWTDGSWIPGGSKVTINGGDGNDYIKNHSGSFISINGGYGNDFIRNEGNHNLTIDGGLDDDTISNNLGDKVTISGGAGDDSIHNRGDSVTIDGGLGDDTISNSGDKVTISGGAGNDSIYTSGNHITINGGDGNDSISLVSYAAYYNLIEYRAGDGSDTVSGLNSTDTLSISGGEYTRSTVGNDVIITVGDGTITLKDAKNKTLNIDGVEITEEPIWTLNSATATYGTKDKTLITINGVNLLKGISLSGKTVTVSVASLNKSGVTISGDGYTLALADDVPTPSINAASWTLNGTTATYKNSATTAGYSCDGKNIFYTAANSGETLITVIGVKSLNGLSLNGKTVTVSKASIGTGTISISKGYSLELADDVPTPVFEQAVSGVLCN